MLALILVVDVWGAFGGIPALEDRGLAPPAVWFQMFQDRGVAEFAQWALFGWFVLLAGKLHAWWYERDRATARFWLLTGVFGLLLLAEDAGSVRDTLMHWGDVFVPGGRSGQLVMIVWFGALAGVLGYAVMRYGSRVLADRRVLGYGVAGVVLFALASVGEAAEHAFGWMGPAGWWVVNDLLDAPHLVELPQHDSSFLVYLVADFIVEEPLELLGIALLTAAALAHARAIRAGATSPAEEAREQR